MTETSENAGRTRREGRTSEAGEQSRRAGSADPIALGLACLKLGVQLLALTRYGWFRDELYYVACSEHLAWGYVDHPPLSIALLRAWRAIFGDSLAAIRLVPALSGAVVVYLTVRTVRGPLASAFGYVIRQRDALRRYLDDGRLRMENNASERELRSIATGRRAWLFMGSDDHAQAAANIFSLVASCKLHGLDVESYLTDIIRVLPYWPRDRYLELAPKYWRGTRARLDERELELPLGHVTVPPPAEEQPTAS